MKDESIKILIIEDNPLDVRLVREMLSESWRFKFEIVETDTLSEGINRIKRGGIDIVLLDLGLPDSQGLETLKKLIAQKSDIPIVVLTGLVDEEMGIQTLREGAQEYLIKGHIESDFLVHTIRYAIERKQLEKKISEQHSHFDAFFENTITPLAFLDKDFNFIRVNKAYADADEREISEFPGHNHFDYYPSDAKIIFEKTVRTKTPVEVLARPYIYPKHPEWGVTFWNWILVPIMDKNGEVEFLVLSLLNITKHKKAEEASRISEEFIKNILEAVDEGFIVIDRDYRIISANRAYCNMVKSSLNDVKDKHCYEVSHSINAPCFETGECCPVKQTFETGGHYACVHTHYDKKGNFASVESKSYPMKDASGKIYAAIEIINDVTEKRRLEEQLRHAQKMEAVGRLTSGIAHDFNNILTAIIGYGSILQSDMPKDDPLKAYVNELLEAAERAVGLIYSLLAFSRKQVLHPMLIDVNEIIKRMADMLLRIIGEDIEFTVNTTDAKLTVLADSIQIEQILMNLATNARDAMPNGGKLTIISDIVDIDNEFIKAHGYGKVGKNAIISVSDTGEGMDDKTKARIFEPFFTTKGIGKGTGLGLAVVYSIVKQHEGYINVYSEPGMGTTFKIYLPLSASPVEEIITTEKPPGPKGGTETIFIAEDDAAVRKLITTVLERAGYSVIEAVNGEDAIKVFNENKGHIALSLLDIVMPKKDGHEVLKEIKKADPQAKAIFMSGYAAENIIKKSEEVDFLLKPLSPKKLLNKIREVIDR